MELRFYGLAACDTCRRALKELRAAGLAPVVSDVRADGVPPALLAAWLERLGPGALVNRRSATWRGLPADTRRRAETAAGAAALIADYPALMKRPVIVSGDDIQVGWQAGAAAALARAGGAG